MVKRPRQIVPYAVLQVRYIAKEAAAIPRRERYMLSLLCSDHTKPLVTYEPLLDFCGVE